MVHRKKGRKLKRTASHRNALFSNLSISLILNKRVRTTEAKAKELRRYIEPLVSKARKALKLKDSAPQKSVHLRREARKFLNNKEALIILFDEIGAKVGDRPGGFTRVLKTGNRSGDGASTAIIEFVDYNFVKEKEQKEGDKASKQDSDAKVDSKKAGKEKTKAEDKKPKSEEKKNKSEDKKIKAPKVSKKKKEQ